MFNTKIHTNTYKYIQLWLKKPKVTQILQFLEDKNSSSSYNYNTTIRFTQLYSRVLGESTVHFCAKLQRPAPATPMEQSLHHLAPGKCQLLQRKCLLGERKKLSNMKIIKQFFSLKHIETNQMKLWKSSLAISICPYMSINSRIQQL